MRTVIAVLALALVATTAQAGVPDNLQCYELSNANLRGLRGVVDLDTPAFGLAPGCRISRPKLYCVPAEASVRPGTLTDGGKPVDEVPFQGRPAESDRVCYRVKCPHSTGTAPDQTVTDRFGTHGFKKLRTEMMCAPATGGTLPPPRDGFQIKFPEIELSPGQDIAYCYYFRTPNAETMPIGRFTSEAGPFVQQLVTFTTTDGGPQQFPVDRLPPGTLSTVDCSPLPTNGVVPRWIYESHEPTGELVFPSDDGTGKPLALEIAPLSSGFILLHATNTSNEVIKTHATVNFEPLDGRAYTKTETFIAYSPFFDIPPLTDWSVETKSCTTPPDTQFWWLSTLTHERAVQTRILDGTNIVLDSLDWSHPSVESRMTPPYRTFGSNKLTYACAYDNPLTRTIHRGVSYQTDEECLAVGYFFPATRPLKCAGGSGPF